MTLETPRLILRTGHVMLMTIETWNAVNRKI